MQSKEEISFYLHQHHERVNNVDSLHQNPLYYASSYKLPRMVKALIDAGVDVNFPGQQGGHLYIGRLSLGALK